MSFPCNQFGFQQNAAGEAEVLGSLAGVRPGGGFTPLCAMFDRVDVNGEGEHRLFRWLKDALPAPADRPDVLADDPRHIRWRPVRRSDVGWNFEKFLLDRRGRPRRRYSAQYEPRDIAADIEKLVGAAGREQRG